MGGAFWSRRKFSQPINFFSSLLPAPLLHLHQILLISGNRMFTAQSGHCPKFAYIHPKEKFVPVNCVPILQHIVYGLLNFIN